MDKLLQYASCSSLHVDNLILLNSCNSLDVSNSFVASSSTMGDLNQILDQNSCSSALDASMSQVCYVAEVKSYNNESTTTVAVNHNVNDWQTTAKPVPETFCKPRPAIPKHVSGGVAAISVIPRRARKLESKMMIQKLGGENGRDEDAGDHDADDSPIDKSTSDESSKTTVDKSASPSKSLTSARACNHGPSIWTCDDEIVHHGNHRGSQCCDEQCVGWS
jgi:hypothetical protein